MGLRGLLYRKLTRKEKKSKSEVKPEETKELKKKQLKMQSKVEKMEVIIGDWQWEGYDVSDIENKLKNIYEHGKRKKTINEESFEKFKEEFDRFTNRISESKNIEKSLEDISKKLNPLSVPSDLKTEKGRVLREINKLKKSLKTFH